MILVFQYDSRSEYKPENNHLFDSGRGVQELSDMIRQPMYNRSFKALLSTAIKWFEKILQIRQEDINGFTGRKRSAAAEESMANAVKMASFMEPKFLFI